MFLWAFDRAVRDEGRAASYKKRWPRQWPNQLFWSDSSFGPYPTKELNNASRSYIVRNKCPAKFRLGFSSKCAVTIFYLYNWNSRVDLLLLRRRIPTSITIHPVALFSILDHYLRRSDSQDRVIGTLLGMRHNNEVEVRSSFAVLHSETDEQVAVDMDYHRTMYELHHKVNSKEVIVGWWVVTYFCLG